MENEIFNQNEVKFFTEVFNYVKSSFRCDISGNISAQDTHDFLLTSSKLSKDIISLIGDITGGTIQGWYEEKQFFFALKLVAAAQQGIPVTPHIPFIEIDLPLPELFTNNNTEYDRPYSKDAISKQNKYESSPNLINLSDSDCPPPKASDNGYQIMISEDGEDEVVEGIYSEPTSNFASHSPSVSSPASDSPTPTNSGGTLEKHWNEPLNAQWHIIVNEEHHQLLGTEEESSDRHSSEGKDDDEEEDYNDGGENCESESEKETVKMEEKCVNNDDENVKEEENIDVNDEDDIDDDDVWTITEEQQQYYTKQFTIMQSDLNGFLPGTMAKQFFEKSKLPVTELRQIWQLADVSRDGALSLEEFFAAMHLVVLRRNKIPLPDKLPKALMPKSFKWTKFIDSPTSTLSSPGPKPVNFDFHKSALEKDPKILHPTPLRVTPEGNRFEVQEENVLQSSHEKEEEEEPIKEPYTLTLKSSSFNLEDEKVPNSSISQSNVKGGFSKSCSGQTENLKNSEENEESGSISLPTFCHIAPSQQTQPLLHLKDIPPPPPPRPSRTHVRSSSLDLNKFSKAVSHKSPPPATTGSPSFLMKKYSENGGALAASWEPRMTNVHEEETSSRSREPIRSSVTKHNPNSAFEIYKKPHEGEGEECGSTKESEKEVVSEEDDEEEEDTSQVTSLSARQNDKREILSSLQTLKEKNSVLHRVNSELNQELAEMIEERIALEFQLEQMKSFST